jgi:hypothetical protein
VSSQLSCQNGNGRERSWLDVVSFMAGVRIHNLILLRSKLEASTMDRSAR